MGARHHSTWSWCAGGFAAACALALACSSEPSPAPSDGSNLFNGSSGGSSSSSSSSGSSGNGGSTSSSGNLAGDAGAEAGDCVSACEAKYPSAAQKAQAIDTCWAQKCPQCADEGDGQIHPPNNGTCQAGVGTHTAACSQCTVDKCCAAWDACFTDAECLKLNECVVACPAKQ